MIVFCYHCGSKIKSRTIDKQFRKASIGQCSNFKYDNCNNYHNYKNIVKYMFNFRDLLSDKIK